MKMKPSSSPEDILLLTFRTHFPPIFDYSPSAGSDSKRQIKVCFHFVLKDYHFDFFDPDLSKDDCKKLIKHQPSKF